MVDLPSHWSGVSGEGLWAIPLGDNLFEVDNIPFHAYGLNLGDIVQAVEPDPDKKPVVVRVVKAGGHRTLRLHFPKTLEPSEQKPYLQTLREVGTDIERADDRFLAVDIPPAADYQAIVELLDRWRAGGVLEFETCEPRVEGSFSSAPEG